MGIEALISLFGGGFSGFLFKFVTERAKERQRQFEMAMKSRQMSVTESDAAAKRDPQSGPWVRRFLAVSVIVALVAIPFLLALLDKPMFVESVQTRREYLWGLVGGGEKVEFVRLDGYTIVNEIKLTLIATVGFYLGKTSAK